MKINIISHYYLPEIGAPSARLSEMSREWMKQGHEVTVFTGIPNHPNGIVPPEYRRTVFKKEVVDGINVCRHWLFATPNKGVLKKTISHASFMTSVLLFSLFRGKKPDVLIVSSPNFFSVISAYVMSRVRRVPYIFEVRDLWPGIFIDLGILKNKRIIRLLERLELFLYRKAAAVVPVTHGFAQDMVRRCIPKKKIEVITNGVDFEAYRPGPRNTSLMLQNEIPIDKFIVMYMGAHGLSHGLRKIVEAAECNCDDGVHFVFVGEGGEKGHIKKQAMEKGLKNITFIPGQPKCKVADFYRMADVCLVPLRDSPGFSTFIPSKMFEVMGCGRPIIASLRGEAADILSRSNAALIIPPEDPSALLEAIGQLRSSPEMRKKMGKNGRVFVKEHYDRRMLARRYLDLLRKVTCEKIC